MAISCERIVSNLALPCQPSRGSRGFLTQEVAHSSRGAQKASGSTPRGGRAKASTRAEEDGAGATGAQKVMYVVALQHLVSPFPQLTCLTLRVCTFVCSLPISHHFCAQSSHVRVTVGSRIRHIPLVNELVEETVPAQISRTTFAAAGFLMCVPLSICL